MALNCTFGFQAFIFGGKNTGPGARVGYAGTADVTFRALTADVALNAKYATTANTALHVADGALSSAALANGTVGAINLSPEVLTNNYFGNVSLNGMVSLNSLAVASTALVAHLNADLLDGYNASAFGDATLANQNAILSRIGTTADVSSLNTTLFAGQKYLARKLIKKQQNFTSSGTWIRPTGVETVHVYMCGGGGGSAINYAQGYFNSYLINLDISVTTNVPIVIGSSSSFGTISVVSGGCGGAGTTGICIVTWEEWVND